MSKRVFVLLILIAGAAVFLLAAGIAQKSYTISLGQLAGIEKETSDQEFLKPLANPPKIVKAIYATGWSAGSEKKLKYLIDLIKSTELNALVVDIKDFSGYLLYDTELELPKKYKAVEKRISKLAELIKRLHKEGIYAIARLSVFQDPRLALSRPDLAVKSRLSEKPWKDRKGLSWTDPASPEVWDYNIAIAEEAFKRGFDEVNFDYIRFPTDGNLSDAIYPFWDGKIGKDKIIKSFFEYLRHKLKDRIISADVFGIILVNDQSKEIGQKLEDAFPFFNYIAPMVYPSHFANGFAGYKNPAKYPYEVIKYAMEEALKKLTTYDQKLTTNTAVLDKSAKSSVISHKSLVKFRPWLQDFDLGAEYDKDMVKREIQAVYDALCGSPTLSPADKSNNTAFGSETNEVGQGETPEKVSGAQICGSSSVEGGLGNKFGGWMLWDAENIYTKSALLEE